MAGNEEGGLEKHFVELCNELAQYHEVIAIGHEKYEQRMSEKVRYIAINLARSRNNPVSLARLAWAIRECKPDVVHAQANKAASMIGKVRFLIPCKTVATVHAIKRDTRMFSTFDAVIAVSKTTASTVRNKNVKVVYNGIQSDADVDEYTQEWLRSKLDLGDGMVAVSVGRLVDVKGFDVLIKAWKDIQATLLIVGDGPLMDELTDLVVKNGLQERVRLLGHREDVRELLALSDLTIISSRKEGFSYVFAESLHSHTPIVATRVPVACEVLPEEYLVEIEDVNGLTNTIEKTLGDLDKVASDFAPIYRFARNELTIESMADKTVSIYKEQVGHVR